jgi:hypothetical protein
MTLEDLKKQVDAYGAKLIVDHEPRGETAGEVWAPKGSVWRLSMTHVLVAHSLSAADPWEQLAEDMSRGLTPCPRLDCEVCARAF